MRPSPPKPWERTGSTPTSRPLTSPVSSQATTPSTPSSLTSSISSTTTPRPPLRPWERRTDTRDDYGNGYNNRDRYGSGYGSGYGGGSYGSSFGSGYGSSYGSNYGSGSSFGSGYGSSSSGYGYGRDRDYSYGGSYGGYGSSGYGSSGYGSSGYGSGYGSYGSGYGRGGGYDSYGRGDPFYSNQIMPSSMMNNNNNGSSFLNNMQYFVDSFSRFSRLLDANYDAMHGSFASVVRLLEHMRRLNMEVVGMLKTTTMFRIVHSLFSRVFGVFSFLVLGKLQHNKQQLQQQQQQEGGGATKGSFLDVRNFEELAKKGGEVKSNSGGGGGKVAGGVQIPASASPRTPPSWRSLLLVFIVTFVGLPVVVNRVFMLLSSRRTSVMELEWSKEGRGEQVVGLHDFVGESSRELPFRKGEVLTIINKFHPDWWEAANEAGRVGVVPVNYISSSNNSSSNSSSSSSDDELGSQPLHDELKSG